MSENTKLDPITFEVLRHSFVTLVDEMGMKLFRASFSPPVNQGRDYSIAIFDPEGNLVTAGRWDMPIHYGTFRFTIREIVRVLGREDILEGDIVLFNDPYAGGTHNQDVRAVRPIFRDGELIAWLVAMAHWADVGGPVPGTFNPEAADAYAEGIRIPPVKIYERGRRLDPVIELVMANIRVPDERRGDLHAQVQTLFSGEQRLLELADKHGV
ncbi:MAG: hydantoinase B/oxoprolinase family protein, partial [Gaiellaceae bacterium]